VCHVDLTAGDTSDLNCLIADRDLADRTDVHALMAGALDQFGQLGRESIISGRVSVDRCRKLTDQRRAVRGPPYQFKGLRSGAISRIRKPAPQSLHDAAQHALAALDRRLRRPITSACDKGSDDRSNRQ
jgi:hypothetical protein